MSSSTTPSLIRFTIPDPSIPVHSLAFFTQYPTKQSALLPTPLHSFRTSSSITPGPAGLDTQGFTYIRHKFSLTDEELFVGRNAEDIYAKECVELVLRVTGAKRGVVHNVEMRRKAGKVEGFEKGEGVELKGGEWDRVVGGFAVEEVYGELSSDS